MKLSVLMSVYEKDSPEHLRLALRSIYEDQTRKPDEIVVVFDGPLPQALLDVLHEFSSAGRKKEIVRYLPQEKNAVSAARCRLARSTARAIIFSGWTRTTSALPPALSGSLRSCPPIPWTCSARIRRSSGSRRRRKSGSAVFPPRMRRSSALPGGAIPSITCRCASGGRPCCNAADISRCRCWRTITCGCG